MRYLIIFIFILLVVAGITVTAQTGDCRKPWKKLISRDVRYRSVASDGRSKISFADKIADEVKSGKLKAFTNYDHDLTTRLSRADLDDIFSPSPDTISSFNPTANSWYTQIINRAFISDSVYHFRTLEKWEFYPFAYKTILKINGIAPVKSVYGFERDFRGWQAIFWLLYNDISGIMNDSIYESRLSDVLWQDYFSWDTTKGAVEHGTRSRTGVFSANAVRIIDLHRNEDTSNHHFKDQGLWDSSIAALFTMAIMDGKIHGWADEPHPFTTILTKSELIKVVTNKPDTIETDDGMNGAYLEKILIRDFRYDAITKYKILEHWNFDPATGIAEITVNGIAPMHENYDIFGNFTGTNTMFWVRIEDVEEIIERYEQYHPDNTFAMHIWEDYFLSDIKPEIVE